MRKLFLWAAAALLVVGCGHAALAQQQQQGAKDFPRYEFFVGYSRASVDNDSCLRVSKDNCVPFQFSSDADFFKPRVTMEGFETSVTRNVNRFFGLKGDFSGYSKREIVTTQMPAFFGPHGDMTRSSAVDSSLYHFMAGPELKARNRTRLTPFAHVLAGAARSNMSIKDMTTPGIPYGTPGSDYGLTAAVGGGLDLRVAARASLRSSFDYNPTRLDRGGPFYGTASPQNNFRTSVGVLFH